MNLTGKGSWFGGPNDSTDSGHTANGETTHTPGIAVYNHATLGGYWRVRAPNGKTVVLKQTDIGPAPGTGRKIDVTYSALGHFGYGEHNFPTDSQFTAEYLGKNGKGAATEPAGTPAQAAAVSAPERQMPSFNDAAFKQAQKRMILANLLKAEGQSARNNPLFASGLLSTKAPQRSEYETAGGEGSPAGSVSLPSGGGTVAPAPSSVGNGPPAVRGLKPVAPPVKVKLPGYITGEGYPKVEQAKHALERAEGHHVSVPELRKQVDQGAAAPHAQVIAQHPQGNVLRTDKGPVFMPHKRSGR